jgi:signal transduction histidine kinase
MDISRLCDSAGAYMLVISDKVPPLVYYSHLPILILSILIGVYVFWKNKTMLSNRLIFVMTITFSFWVFLDSVFWASNRGDVIMFVWALQVLIEPLVHVSALYLLYVLINGRDVAFSYKMVIFLIYLPLIIIVPTNYLLTSFDVTSCLSQETVYSYYSYVIEIICTILLLGVGVTSYFKTDDKIKRNQTVYLTLSMLILLLSFSWGAITGSLTEDWSLAQYGLFGMPIFISILSYTIVKFKTFNLKLIASNVIIFSLWCLTGSLLFIQDISISHAVTAITLIISIILGIFMVESIRKEVRQRERIESLANDLSVANGRLLELDKQKSEFVSLATHQLRAPLTAMKGYSSLILEGEMGEIAPETKQAVSRIYDSANTLTNIVNDYLNISRIELGTMRYTFSDLDFKKLVEDVIGELKPNIEKKGLKFTFNCDPSQRYNVHADPDKLKQVIANLIDNSLKYTPSGSIELSLIRKNLERKLLLSIKDTGVGIDPTVMPKLFSKFVRSENANKQNIYGTGLGLYVARQMIIAHKGKVWAESLGDGKGSTFFVELDIEI